MHHVYSVCLFLMNKEIVVGENQPSKDTSSKHETNTEENLVPECRRTWRFAFMMSFGCVDVF